MIRGIRWIFNKLPILKYILTSLFLWFFLAVAAGAAAFGILWVTGYYEKLERVLNLKYNAPFVTVPFYAFAALAVLCFFVGFLLYFHKYRRGKSRSKFREALQGILKGQAKIRG